MSQTPVTVDRRYHDAVIFGLDGSQAGHTFSPTVELARRLQEVGIARAVDSAGRDCKQILHAAGVGDLFGVRVDGVGATGGAALLAAAGRLGVRPDRCVVIDSTETGVRASSDGGFGLVIGIDRSGHADPLLSCGASTVVTDLAEVTVRCGDTAITALPDALQVYHQLKLLVAAVTGTTCATAVPKC